MAGRLRRMFGARLLALAGIGCVCLVLTAPAAAGQHGSPQFLAQRISPQNGYYGECDSSTPVAVTVQADLDSPLSLAVTLRYQYVSADPLVPPSPELQKNMVLVAAESYTAAIDISDEASAYLKGGDGSLTYHIEAKDADGNLSQSDTHSVGIHHCVDAGTVAQRGGGT